MMHTNKKNNFIKASNELALLLEEEKNDIIRILGEYEPYNVANDELERSISALRGFEAEFSNLKSDEEDLVVSTFFPLNLPLYSLVLFAIAPSVFASTVYLRAPAIMQEILAKLVEKVQLSSFFPEIIVKECSRSEFMSLCVSASDVILFTGKYENALAIQKQCPQALFIFNGGGVNPAIVFEDADVALAADKIFEMRTFNSGQDCAGTDAILVHESVYDSFISRLKENISSCMVGAYGDPETLIGPILRSEYIDDLETFLEAEADHIILKGSIDKDRRIVTPYIVTKSANNHEGEFHEFFAPVFYVLTFKDEEEVERILEAPEVKRYSMYVTYFGAKDRLSHITFAKLLKNVIVNDVEQGNEEYGGFGSKANFVCFENKIEARPILISREIDTFLVNDSLV